MCCINTIREVYFADLFIRRSLFRREVYFGKKFISERSLFRREVYFGVKFISERSLFWREVYFGEKFNSERSLFQRDFFISERFLYFGDSYLGKFLSRRTFYFGELISENMRIFYCFFFGTNRWQHQINSVAKHIPGGARYCSWARFFSLSSCARERTHQAPPPYIF